MTLLGYDNNKMFTAQVPLVKFHSRCFCSVSGLVICHGATEISRSGERKAAKEKCGPYGKSGGYRDELLQNQKRSYRAKNQHGNLRSVWLSCGKPILSWPQTGRHPVVSSAWPGRT